MIELNSIKFSYLRKEQLVLDGCSFCVKSSGLFLIVGDNGSGKSTLLDVITGFKQASEGNVFINGINVYKNSKSLNSISKIISYMPSSLRFPGTLRVSSIIELYCGPYFADELCKELGLEKFMDKKYTELSDGYKTRLALNVCLSKGAYLFLDEPLKSQDEELKKIFPTLLKKYTVGRNVLICSPQSIEGVKWDGVYQLQNGNIQKC